MDFIERNEIFMDNEGMIHRVMRRNWPLIHAMRLDRDDVYQELAMAALNAIENFDPTRSACIQAHIWMQLQYAVLTIKRQYKPCGLTCAGGRRPVVISLDQSEGMEQFPAAAPQDEPAGLSLPMRQALSRLDEEDRRAVIRYLDGRKTRRESAVSAALDKVRYYYLAAVSGAQYSAEVW